MKSSMMACAVLAVLAGCSSDGNSSGNMFAGRNTTVEYYRVFDIKTDAAPEAVAKAASAGINRNVKDAVVSVPPGVEVAELPGHFKMLDPSSAPPGAPAGKGPSCEGAAWTAKAAPRVRGGDNMNMIACLFPYKSGYHLDMYAVFTKPEGGLMQWPRKLGSALMGTPETFTETTMMDVVRAIRESTSAQVALVEAKPTMSGTPWMESKGRTASAAPSAELAGAKEP